MKPPDRKCFKCDTAHWPSQPCPKGDAPANLVESRQPVPTIGEIKKATADLERAFPTKSTAARKDVLANGSSDVGAAGIMTPTGSVRPRLGHGSKTNSAGTQAPPVDTNPKAAAPAQPTVAEEAAVPPTTTAAPPTLAQLQALADDATARIAAKPKGRPRIHEDRKAYKAQKERERRERQKQAKP